ncbi:MAG: ATP/GTP-binding protein [Candidatus Bathyarchaeia archaeon]
MFTVFIIGMAGSGKSMLTGVFQEWLRFKDQNALSLNLDPGALKLPYNPDIDVREYIDIEELMEKYELGPNGALILASDLLADHVEEFQSAIEEYNPDILLVDTPGQIELFAFRESGPFIAKAISQGEKAVVYLLDAPFCKNPLNYVSNMFMAAAVYNRLLQPQIYALSKADLIQESEVETIINWSLELPSLEKSLEENVGVVPAILTRELAEALHRTELITEPIPVSSKTEEGFLDLYAALTRIAQGGEEFTH